MNKEFEHQWRAARNLENAGNLEGAKAIYETLLAEDPARLYVRLRLSVIEQAFGNYRVARDHALMSANDVRDARWNDLAAVSRRLLTFDENSTVYDLIKGVDWTHPEIIRNSAILSQHLWLTDHVEEALQMIETASARAQPSCALSYSRALVLGYLGRMQESAEEYERCLALDPNYPYAHWSLAYHQKADPPGSRIQRIRAAQSRFASDAPEQAYLHYALFKEYDDTGETNKAWESLMTGARIKRQSQHYDSMQEELGFNAIEAMVTHDFMRDRARPQGATPIFIVGMPRTGTTLLERILGAHSRVAPAGELNDFRSALSLASDSFLGNFITADAVEGLRGIDFADVGRTYLERTAAHLKGKPFFIDKNPANFVFAGHIAKALPGARIICLRRDAMDSCMSNLKELFSSDAYGYSYDLGELAEHYLRFDRLCAHWQKIIPGQFHEVDYQELVTDPVRTAERVMAFCGLPFEPDCVDITRNTAPVSTASSSQVRQPINQRGVGAWRKYATQLEPLRARLEGKGG